MTNANNKFLQQFFRYRLQHILFWIGYIWLQTIIYKRYDGTGLAFLNALVVNIFHATAVYFNFYFLIPRLLLLKRYIVYFLMLLFTVTLVSYLLVQVMILLEPDSENFLIESFSGLFIGVLFTVTITMVAKIMINWYQQQQVTIQLEKQQIETELKFLKSQIQPHFLFNVLNNIYSLALQKSDQTPDVVLRLSEFLRYILYEAGDKKIMLSKEVDFLNNYIALQRVRFSNRANIEFITEGVISSQFIEPMLLITFLENSFKHGVGNQLEKVWVSIHLQASENQLTFDIKNSTATDIRKEVHTGGIGLENVKRRLNLLYPQQHELNIENKENEYHVQLKLNKL